MGTLLAIFKPEHVHKVNFFLDFQNYQEPTAGPELEVYNDVKELLKRDEEMLNILKEYKGCGGVIQKAISSKEHEEEAWDVLIPSVEKLRLMYEFSQQIANVAPKLLGPLCNVVDEEQSLVNKTALAKLLCDLFNFILDFDDKKMINPHIQNDFSFFRRSMPKLKNSNRNTIPEDIANRMSLFYAYPTPMMYMLTQLVKDQQGIPKEAVVAGLSQLANVCLDMVEKGMFESKDTNVFCLRAMTAAIILVDHISDEGVFLRKSPINIKNAIITLRDKQEIFGTGGLLNALKYTTKHLNDQETPSTIKNLLT